MKIESAYFSNIAKTFTEVVRSRLFLIAAAITLIALAIFLVYRHWFCGRPPPCNPPDVVDLTKNRLGAVPIFRVLSDLSLHSASSDTPVRSTFLGNRPEITIEAKDLSDGDLTEWLLELSKSELNLWSLSLEDFSGDEKALYASLAPFQNLASLTFCRCGSLTKEGLEKFLSKLSWKRLSLSGSTQFSKEWCQELAKNHLVISPSGVSNEEVMRKNLLGGIYAVTQAKQLSTLETSSFFCALDFPFSLDWDQRPQPNTDIELLKQIFAWFRKHDANLIGFKWTNAPEGASFLADGKGLPIRTLSLKGTKLPNEQLRALHSYPELTYLDLSKSEAPPEGNVYLMKLKLKQLILDNYQISGEMVLSIAQTIFGTLEYLSLRDVPVNPKYIDTLVQMGERNLLKPFVIIWSPQTKRYQIELGTCESGMGEPNLQYVQGPFQQLRFGMNSDVDSSFFTDSKAFNDPSIQIEKIDFQNNPISIDLLPLCKRWPLQEVLFTNRRIQIHGLEVQGQGFLKAAKISIVGFERVFFNFFDGFVSLQELLLCDRSQLLETNDIETLIRYKDKGVKKITLQKLDLDKKLEKLLKRLISGLDGIAIDKGFSEANSKLIKKICADKKVKFTQLEVS